MERAQLYEEESTGDLFTPEAPVAPQNMEETGLNAGFLTDLILKTLLARGTLMGIELSRELAISFRILEESLLFLKDQKCVEISGGDLIGTASYRFLLTDLGRQRARDAMAHCSYIGPAPVPMERYVEQCYKQVVTGIPMNTEGLRNAFSHLIVSDDLIDTIGPAIVSGKAVFIYGPPGTGKTSLSRAVGEYMNNSGGEIYIPHALMAEDGVVTLFDPIVHRPIEDDAADVGPNAQALVKRLLNEDTPDPRWVKIRRPVIIVAGELTLDMLDLRYSSNANVYQAPLHIKANGGIFMVDDFGRQLCSPRELLNRWILPLEDRHDFLTLASGKKVMVPFEQLIIFSTNMDPADLVDDAFLRRIRHKFSVDAPSKDLYIQIFNLNCKRLRLNECPEAIEFLYERYYNDGRLARPSDCRDLLEIVVSICRFREEKPHLTRELIELAARQFIAEF
ncbi:proteasome-activating nucleotidase [Planctomycetes bacterium Pan216]|uniref:Proteasome-activating nucleotidase n=1 Tax=Kolteria novifilia TaxID=2527975 RepID=A0A518BCB1_9BACT|nr:proteasome-activating nucleotidase [Planctomycetes bacterium Pan216]